MEKTQRAGIATFVMRDREYLVAIFAQNGILCAETLRFHDEIKGPEDDRLARAGDVPASGSRPLSIPSTPCPRTFSRDELVDQDTRKLKAIIEKKKRTGKDLIRTDHEPEDVESEEDGDIDLLATIRQSLRHRARGITMSLNSTATRGISRKPASPRGPTARWRPPVSDSEA